MDDISLKREALLRAYSGDNWRRKVVAMSESQVIAVYLRLKNQGKI